MGRKLSVSRRNEAFSAALRLIRAGAHVRDAAEQIGVSRSTLQRWLSAAADSKRAVSDKDDEQRAAARRRADIDRRLVGGPGDPRWLLLPDDDPRKARCLEQRRRAGRSDMPGGPRQE